MTAIHCLALADNLLVILVLVAIITGIVIDSFGARREQDDDRSDQLANSCETPGHGLAERYTTAVSSTLDACRPVSDACVRTEVFLLASLALVSPCSRCVCRRFYLWQESQ